MQSRVKAICKVTLAHLFIACYVILADITLYLLPVNATAGENANPGLPQPGRLDLSLLGVSGGIFLLFQAIAGLAIGLLLLRYSRYLLGRAFLPRMLVITGFSLSVCGLLAALCYLTYSGAVITGVTAHLGQAGNPTVVCIVAQGVIFGAWAAWWLGRIEPIGSPQRTN